MLRASRVRRGEGSCVWACVSMTTRALAKFLQWLSLVTLKGVGCLHVFTLAPCGLCTVISGSLSAHRHVSMSASHLAFIEMLDWIPADLWLSEED